MSKWIELEPGVFTAPQLTGQDFAALAALGFKSVINNRPDDEAEDQLPHAQAAQAAAACGLIYHHLPVANLDVTDDGPVEALKAKLDTLPRPLLFYCRSGSRSTLLWAQASANRLGVDQVITLAQNAGYDISLIRDILIERAG